MDLMFTQTLQVICIILNELLLKGILSVREVHLTTQKTLYGAFWWWLELFVEAVCVNPIRENLTVTESTSAKSSEGNSPFV